MLSIGIDIDGVMCNTYAYWDKIANRLGVDFYNMTEYNGMFKTYTPDGRNFGKLLFHDYHQEWLNNAEPINGAIELVNELNKHPNANLYFVTAREKATTELPTANWLNKHGVDPTIPTIHDRHKLNAPIQVILEDKLETVLEFEAASRMGILIDYSYNRSKDVRYRVPNINEGINIIRQFL